MDILRFLTAGSVDDGKSTLIGRLLYDSKSILVDQLETLQQQSKNVAEGEIDLALLTDGLRAEREQGITIDVAYKYFTTPNRKFIIADTPGHIQYTRNMITGASTADAMVILIDARNGIIEQTKRHSYIAAALNIEYVIVAINKMDLMNYSKERYKEIVTEYEQIKSTLKLENVRYIPISALTGENVIHASSQMSWYQGVSLLTLLEELPVRNASIDKPFRFQVQYVNRPQTKELHDFRGYAGKVLSGIISKGDDITVWPSQLNTRVANILVAGESVSKAQEGQVVTIELEDDVDISRGDIITLSTAHTQLMNEVDAWMCWMDERPLVVGGKYLLQQNSKQVRCVVKEVVSKMDIQNLVELFETDQVKLNDLVHVKIKVQQPLFIDNYSANTGLGQAILVDETAHGTAGALMFIHE